MSQCRVLQVGVDLFDDHTRTGRPGPSSRRVVRTASVINWAAPRGDAAAPLCRRCAMITGARPVTVKVPSWRRAC